MVRSRYAAAVLALIVAASAATARQPFQVATAQTQSAGQMMTQTTASYQVVLDVGPAMVMLSPERAQGASMGEIMAMPDQSMMSPSSSTSSMPDQNMASSSPFMSSMNGQESMTGDSGSSMMMMTTDNGQPVNHHLEVHVANKSTGMPQADVSPQVSIASDATGQTRTLEDVVAMYDVQMGPGDLHYGNNLYLQDGATYTITITIGGETAQFSHVPASGGMGLASESMSPMNNATPMTGH